MNFSYFNDSDLMPKNELAWDFSHPDYDDAIGGEGEDRLNTSHSFMSRVLSRTHGPALPFIFQPDSTNNSPDQFSICKFNQTKFDFTQSAPNLYSMKLNIRESW